MIKELLDLETQSYNLFTFFWKVTKEKRNKNNQRKKKQGTLPQEKQ